MDSFNIAAILLGEIDPYECKADVKATSSPT